jgi:hypothetical protein
MFIFKRINEFFINSAQNIRSTTGRMIRETGLCTTDNYLKNWTHVLEN